MPLRLCSTFFLRGTGGYNDPNGGHLMVCVRVRRLEDEAIIVPIVSRHAYSDLSCLIEVGDHPFVTRQSCAAFDHARCVSIAVTDAEIKAGSVILRDPIGPDLLRRFLIGLVTSDETEPWLFNAAEGTKLTAYLKHMGYM